MVPYRFGLLVLLAAGCAAPRSGNGPNGVGSGGGADASRDPELDWGGLDLLPLPDGGLPIDLASSDLKGADLKLPPDMTKPPDLYTPPAPVPDGGVPTNGAELCAGAPALPAGVLVQNQDTTGMTNDYDYGVSPSSACAGPFGYTYDGPDGVYTFSIPAGKTLTVVLTKSNLPTVWDPALAIVTSCTPATQVGPSCLSGSDALTGDTETVSYKNNGAAALPVFIIVDSFLPGEYGKYSIRADVN
jgi:hypothetical protein